MKKRSPARQARPAALPDATLSEEGGLRYLHLETPWIQGAMRIRQPLKLELDYIQRMMAWLLLREPEALPDTRCLQLGLGAAAITKYCHQVLHLPTTAVELNPQVIAACRNWFKLPPDGDGLQVVLADAARYVADPAHAASAEALCVDLYDHEAASPVLDDEGFYRDCRQVLAHGGVMSVNLFGRDASFDRSAARIAAAFGADHMVMFKPTTEGNTIVMAWRDFVLPAREVLAERAETLQTRWKLPARKWVKLLSAYSPSSSTSPTPSTTP